MDEILADVLADLEPVLNDTHTALTSQQLPLLLCDGNQVRQLLQNLISNAVKYRDATRTPQITISAIEAEPRSESLPEQHPRVRIIVQDNGIGFDQKYCEQIFEPFQRLHGPDEYEGTGIGLAICRKIVQRHGGSITAQSQPGVGSVFTFTLPLPNPSRLDH